jgi:4-hydroxybenzoate polyprenyltransferase
MSAKGPYSRGDQDPLVISPLYSATEDKRRPLTTNRIVWIIAKQLFVILLAVSLIAVLIFAPGYIKLIAAIIALAVGIIFAASKLPRNL